MPLPIWLIPIAIKGAAVVAGAVGVGSAVNGGAKMVDAKDTMELAKTMHEENMKKFEETNEKTLKAMDKLGTLELKILESFGTFSDVFEQIQNRPVFDSYTKNGVTLPKYDGEDIKEVSVGASVVLVGLGGAGLGTAGGIAAAGAVTTLAAGLGTASTGAAIGSLSGAAATNATLALLGGGTLAAGGGGMAAGAAALSAATLGVGILVTGVIVSVTGGKLSDKADEAWEQMRKAEKEINTICEYLNNLYDTSNRYYDTLTKVNTIYKSHLSQLQRIVCVERRNDWNTFTTTEKRITENTVLLVGLLYKMCKVEIVLKSENENGINTINTEAVETSTNNAEALLADRF